MIQYSIGELIDKLAVIHLKIWHLEEEIANARSAARSDAETEQLCDQVVTLNTSRNEIVKSINELFEKRA